MDSRKVPIKAASIAQMQRTSLARRRNHAVALRKQKKADLLQRRRGLSSATADVEVLNQAVQSFIQNPDASVILTIEQAIRTNPNAAKFFSELVSSEAARTLATGLLGSLVRSESTEHVLSILLSLVSFPMVTTSDVGYYGKAPPSWTSHLLCADAAPALITLSLENNRMAMDVLTHLLQDSPIGLVKMLLPYWSQLVAGLPTTSTLCATLSRQDQTSRASDLLAPLSIPIIRDLLVNEATCAAGAMLMASLTQREDEAVCVLLQDNILVTALVSVLQIAMGNPAIARESLSVEYCLQALANIAVSNEGRYVEPLIATPEFLPCLQQIVEQRIHLNAVSLARALLCDSGLPSHTSTTMAVAALVPRFLSIIVDGGSWQWQRDSACLLQTVWSPPPLLEAFDNSEVQNILRDMAADLLLHSEVIRALVGLLCKPDVDVVVASLSLLDRLLRTLPRKSMALFREWEGVEALENLLQHDTTNPAIELAADLMDDLFAEDEDDDDDDDDDTGFAADLTFTVPTEVSGKPMGRGRGRNIPAWMQHQTHGQLP